LNLVYHQCQEGKPLGGAPPVENKGALVETRRNSRHQNLKPPRCRQSPRRARDGSRLPEFGPAGPLSIRASHSEKSSPPESLAPGSAAVSAAGPLSVRASHSEKPSPPESLAPGSAGILPAPEPRTTDHGPRTCLSVVKEPPGAPSPGARFVDARAEAQGGAWSPFEPGLTPNVAYFRIRQVEPRSGD
jgi:hypothetical protein